MRLKYRGWIITAGIAVIITAAGCVITGNNPAGFLYRLFTMGYAQSLETGASVAMVAAFGFFASFHCIGMCGGVVMSLCAGSGRGAARGLVYNAGRVASYTLTGLLAGALGTVVGLNGHLRALVPLVCAAVMLFMGLRLLGLFRWLGMSPGENGAVKKLRGKGAFPVGFLTGFMPCGMLQIAQIHALGSGSPFMGAAYMFAFAAASSPALIAFGALTGALTPEKRVIAVKIAAALVIVLGVGTLARAVGLLGA